VNTRRGSHERDAAALALQRFVPREDVTVFALVLTAGPVVAHEGHDHKIMGTITMAAADHVMLKDKDGKDITVKVTKETKVKSKPAIAMTVEEIKAGTRVVITATQAQDKSFTAKTIEVGVAAAAAK
jgi:hypothetical protein